MLESAQNNTNCIGEVGRERALQSRVGSVMSAVSFATRGVAGLLLAASVVVSHAAAQADLDGADAVGLRRRADAWHTVSAWSERPATAVPSAASVLEAAQAELAMGRADRALAILNENPLPDSALDGAGSRVYAVALYRQVEYESAAALFERTGRTASGLRRGVLLTQAAEAYALAGREADAKRLYSQAAPQLPSIAGWLALREAQVTPNPVEALGLLRSVPADGWLLAGAVRADILEAAGDTVAAIFALAKVERYVRAAEFSLLVGDSTRARDLTYRAVSSGDSSQAVPAAALALERFPPAKLEEYRSTARVLARYGQLRDAVTLLEQAVASVDSSAETLLLLGRLTAATGDRWGALDVYHRAAQLGEAESAEAEYQRARLLLSLRQTERAQIVLRGFVDQYPSHSRAPTALYLVGDLNQDAGRRATADSIYRVVAEVWPNESIASQARMRLASHALTGADTSAALRYYRAEARHDGAEARASRFQIARLLMSGGDSVAARQELISLARDDSLGYYGTIARQVAGMDLPKFERPEPFVSSSAVSQALSEFDLLEAVGFEPEAEAALAGLRDSARWEPQELLEIAEGLNARGHTVEGIRIGWALTRYFTLNNPRVIRVIFPWPYRHMVELEAEKFGLDPYLVAGLIRQESAFEPEATSRAGARGLMQLMPSTARGLARRIGIEWDNSMLTVPDANVHVGTAHLAALMRTYQGEIIPSLAAYNAGGRPVARWMRFPEASDPFLFVERIPYVETRGYVRTLLRNKELYTALYGEPSDAPVQ
jgi:soluble lytic murein transglycosylase-like protein